MRISIGVGIIIATIGTLIGLILNDWSITVKICGYISGGCLALVGLFNGAFINGDKYRGNYSNETEETRREKNRTTNNLLIISLPNIIVAIIIFVVQGN